MKNKKFTIGIFGFGCVASGLLHILKHELKKNIILKKIVVKDENKIRKDNNNIISFNKDEIIKDNEIEIVVELINNPDEAYFIVKEALLSNKHVVSANKKMLSIHLEELQNIADKNNLHLLYEASVGGSIPILRTLENHFKKENIFKISAIINGTCNYILTRSNEGIKYETALRKAQELGFAESNPSLDVEGFDSKYKLSLLIKHTFGVHVNPNNLFHFGINNLKESVIKIANQNNIRLKLIAHSEKIDNTIVAYVLPEFIDAKNEFYNVSDEYNSVVLEGDYCGKQQFIGKGAGSLPTASAVYADLQEIASGFKINNNALNNKELNVNNEAIIDVFLSSEFIEQNFIVYFNKTYKIINFEDSNIILGKISIKNLKNLIENFGKIIFVAKLNENILENFVINDFNFQNNIINY